MVVISGLAEVNDRIARACARAGRDVRQIKLVAVSKLQPVSAIREAVAAGHRVRILEHAIAPLAPQLRPAVRDRLHHALSVVYGIEPYVILKDIWGLRDREVERTALWMADALIEARKPVCSAVITNGQSCGPQCANKRTSSSSVSQRTRPLFSRANLTSLTGLELICVTPS